MLQSMRSQRVRHDSVTELTDRNPNQNGLGSVLVLSPLGWVTWAKLLGLPKSSLGFLCKILWKTLNFSQHLTSLQNLHCLNYKHELPLSSAVPSSVFDSGPCCLTLLFHLPVPYTFLYLSSPPERQ